jgi:FAD/FMN-containing dehydrogenase
LTLDTITSIDAVLANGTAVTASSSQNRDLFWALRGAGPGFAVVTSFKMKTFPAPPVNVNWAYTYVYSTAQMAAKAYSIAQAFGQTSAPKELGYGIMFFPGNQFIVRGVYYGPKANMDRILAPLLTQLTSLNDGKAPKAVVNTQGWIASLTELDGTTLQTSVRGYDEHDTFVSVPGAWAFTTNLD